MSDSQSMRFVCRTIICSLLMTVFPIGACVRADQVRKRDGTVLSGRIVEENESYIVIEEADGNRRMVAVAVITQIDRTAPAPDVQRPKAPVAKKDRGPACYPLPVVGNIGEDVTAESLRRALVDARKLRVDVVLLYFDTPGGSVAEKRKIIGVLQEFRDLRVVAHVKKALSAGAIIAMTCHEIFVDSDGVIGAAAVLNMRGLDAVDEKIAGVVAAEDRAAVEAASHSPLFVDAMEDIDSTIAVVEEHGKPVLKRWAPGVGGEMLKPGGRILTLTGNEAAKCGLAHAAISSADDIAVHLGFRTWHMATDSGWRQMQQDAANRRRQRIIDAYEPRLTEIQRLLSEVTDSINLNIELLGKLRTPLYIQQTQAKINQLTATREEILKLRDEVVNQRDREIRGR